MKSLLSFFIRNMVLKFALNKVRQRATLVYLKILQATRRSLIAAVGVFFVLQLMVLGFVGSIVTSVWLWVPDLDTKLAVLLGVFFACFVLPFVALLFLFSESFWLKASGVVKMLEAQNEK